MEVYCTETLIIIRRYFSQWPFVPFPSVGEHLLKDLVYSFLDHFFIFQKNSLHLKMANFSSLKRRSIFTSRKILREKLELHSASKKSLNIAKMVEKRFELPTSTHDLSYEKIRLADCHKIPIFSDKSENPHARVTGVHKFLTFTPP